MSKLRADSKWNDLTQEQLDTLEAWLFEENLSYREVLERLQKEFGVTAPLSSLARLYQRLARGNEILRRFVEKKEPSGPPSAPTAGGKTSAAEAGAS